MSISRFGGQQRSLAGVAILVLIIGAGSAVSGQSFPGGVPTLMEQVLAALGALEGQAGDVEAGIDGLQSDVDALQVSVDALGPVAESPVRTTPAVWVDNGVIDCIVTNVSSEPRQIAIEMINGTTGGVISVDAKIVEPGRAKTVGVAGPNALAFCRFTVLDGTRADIRGSLTIGASTIADQSLVAVPAE